MSNKIKKIVTIEDVRDFEDRLQAVFFNKIKTKLGDSLIIDADNQPLTPDIEIKIKTETMMKHWDYELGKVPTKEEIIEHYYSSGRSHRVQIPLKPLIMPQTSKAPSAISYLLVSATTCLADSDQLPHMLASKTIEEK